MIKLIETPIKRRGGFYFVDGKKEPDAWKMQTVANDNKVRSRVVFADQNNERAIVIARATAPSGWYVEATVIHYFQTEVEKKAMQYLTKDIVRVEKGQPPKVFADVNNPFDSYGRPLLSPEGQLIMLNRMLTFKSIAIRDAESKAMRRVQMKVTNSDWRDEDELEAEIDEVVMVTNDIRQSKGQPVLEVPNPKKIAMTVNHETDSEFDTEAQPYQHDEVTLPPKDKKKHIVELGDLSTGNPEVNTDGELQAIDDADSEPEPETKPKDKLKIDVSKEEAKANYDAIKEMNKPKKPVQKVDLSATTTVPDQQVESRKIPNETILGPDSTEADIEKAAEEIRQEYLAEEANTEIKKLQAIDPKKITNVQQERLNHLQKVLRKEGLRKATESLRKQPHLADYEPNKTEYKEVKGR